MDWLLALYVWLAIALTGPLAAFLFGYFADERKAGLIGMAASVLMALAAALDAASKSNGWIALGATVGLGTAWWHLFGRGSRQAG